MTDFAIDRFPKERFGIITGSRCSPLVPKKDAKKGMDTLALKLANEIVFNFYDEQTSWQLEHGKMAESFAFIHYQTYVDKSIQFGKFYYEKNFGGSTDAETDLIGVDFKCPTTLLNWTDYLINGISDNEYNQAQLYMLLTKKDKWQIAAYLTETLFMSDNGLRYPVDEKYRMILIDVDVNLQWRDKFMSNVPYVINKRDEYVEILNKLVNKVDYSEKIEDGKRLMKLLSV